MPAPTSLPCDDQALEREIAPMVSQFLPAHVSHAYLSYAHRSTRRGSRSPVAGKATQRIEAVALPSSSDRSRRGGRDRTILKKEGRLTMVNIFPRGEIAGTQSRARTGDR